MVKDSFPELVDWRKLGQQQAHWQIKTKLTEFERFSAALMNVGEDTLDIECHFLRDEQYRYYIKGHVKAQVNMQCQRCMEALPHSIDDEFSVYIVMTEEQQKALPKELDSVMAVDENQLDLKALLEDELLLQLPYTSLHDISECGVNYVAPDVKPVETKRNANAFAILETLKQDK